MKQFPKEILEKHVYVNYQIGDFVTWTHGASLGETSEGIRLMHIDVYRHLFDGKMAAFDTDNDSFFCKGPFLVLDYEMVRSMLIVKVWSMKRQRVGYRVADLFVKSDS